MKIDHIYGNRLWYFMIGLNNEMNLGENTTKGSIPAVSPMWLQ